MSPSAERATADTPVKARDSGWIGVWLQENWPQGLSTREAEQLCVSIYYRFDGIPQTLRGQLSRWPLAKTFAELARMGWIRTGRAVGDDPVFSQEHWLILLTPKYGHGAVSAGASRR
jgi:hypothetical protein